MLINHKTLIKLLTGTVLSFTAVGWVNHSFAEDTKNKPVEADNSGVNRRDEHAQHRTADGQVSATAADVELVRKIRESLTKNESLSTYGKNIKILATGGIVTLRGPVRSAQEKADIERAAKTVAGTTQVNNELEVTR